MHAWLVEAAGAHAIVEAEEVEYGTVGEMQRGRGSVEADEAEPPVGFDEGPAREPLPQRSSRCARRVTDPEPPRRRVEPVPCRGKRLPHPIGRLCPVDAPPRPEGGGQPQATRPGRWE